MIISSSPLPEYFECHLCKRKFDRGLQKYVEYEGEKVLLCPICFQKRCIMECVVLGGTNPSEFTEWFVSCKSCKSLFSVANAHYVIYDGMRVALCPSCYNAGRRME